MDEITDKIYQLMKYSIDILEKLDLAKIELKKVGSIAHQKGKFATASDYEKLQKSVASLKCEHQRTLLEISYLKKQNPGKSLE